MAQPLMSTDYVPLLDWIPYVSPHMRRPEHMSDWTQMIERTIHEPVRACNSKPTRHWKTQTTLHGVVWIVKMRPTWRVLLMAAEHSRAEWLGEQTRVIRDRAGIKEVRGQDTKRNWSTEQGGGVTVISAGQSGLGVDSAVVIADDPLDEHGFYDPEERAAVDDALAFYTSRAITPEGRRGSVLINMSRGHPDDPVGRRIGRKWETISSPAIIDEGLPTERAFAPDWIPLEELKRIKSEMAEQDPTLRRWWSQWMNDPQPDVLGLFKNPSRYNALPSSQGFRTVIGADLSYSSAKHADYFALVVLKIWPEMVREGDTMKLREVAYVVNAWRERWDPAQSESIIRLARAMYPGANVFSYMSGPEIGIAKYLEEKGLAVEVIPARYSKRQRAQNAIDMSNAGRVRFPESAPWVGGFVARMMLFSGVEGAGDDDEIDALASAVRGAMSGAAPGPKAIGKRRI